MKTDKWYDKIEKKFIQVQTPCSNSQLQQTYEWWRFIWCVFELLSNKCVVEEMLLWAIMAFFDLALVEGSILHKKILEEDSLCLKNFKLSFADVLLLAKKVE